MSRLLTFLVAGVAASAALFYFGTGLHPVWWITWLAPFPVLLIAPYASGRSAFLAAFLASALGGLNMWKYLHGLLGIPVGIVLGILLMPAIFFGLDLLLFRWLVRRGAVWQAALAFAATWVSYEFLGSLLSPHGTFGNLAYSQMDFLPGLQIASVTGIWGISFCLLLLPATLAAVLGGYGDKRQKRALAAATGIFLATVLGFGYWRVHTTPTSTESVTVGLITSDLPQNILPKNRDGAVRLLGEYSAQVQNLAAQGAQVVVMPEKIAIVLDDYLDTIDQSFESAAARSNVSIVVGVLHIRPKAKWNEARVYSPDGEVSAIYAKHHMLPAFESQLTPGIARTLLRQPSGVWGITICKDMDFPLLSRQYGRDGAGLLLTPAWDFVADGWLHGRMAILRGVEDGFSMARAPRQGILTVSDDRGHVLAERDTGSAPFATLVASVPVVHEETLYARFGDWFGWLSVALVVICVATGIRA
jgi:apolipoprotein N-acyltransferase